MRALPRIALPFAAVAMFGISVEADGKQVGPTSLIAARWQGSDMVGQPCADVAPGDICFNVLVQPKLSQVQTLSGPAVAVDARPIMWTHADYVPTVWIVIAVWHEKSDGRWHGQRVGIAGVGKPACVNPDEMKELKASPPAGNWRDEDSNICFKIP